MPRGNSATQEAVAPKANENVTTAAALAQADYTPANLPTSFAALHHEQLVAAAQAFGVDAEGNDAAIRAELESNGVTWAMYCTAFNLPVPAEAQVEPVVLDESEVETVETTVLATKPEYEDLNPAKKYLVKFVGQNPYFEHGTYKFTQASPYAIMAASDAQDALEREPQNFRQAFPKELEEFYS